jgi:disulfide bond formation protein DsbB
MDIAAPFFGSRRIAYGFAFLVCASIIGYALYLQYGLGLEPCPLCIFQRVAIIAMGGVFLIAAVVNPEGRGAKIFAVVQVLLGATGIALALRHLWIQSLPAGSVPTCGMGLNYMLESFPVLEVVERVLKGSGECHKVDVVLGLSIPMWTLLLFTGLIAWSVLLAREQRD